MLLLQQMDRNEFFCQACPYTAPVTRKYVSKKAFKTKQVDDILGGKEGWENVDSTEGMYELTKSNVLLVVTIEHIICKSKLDRQMNLHRYFTR
jgi:hypothetical protein